MSHVMCTPETLYPQQRSNIRIRFSRMQGEPNATNTGACIIHIRLVANITSNENGSI
jgi:hypothetical protein